MRISCQTCTSAAGQYQKSAPVVSHPDWFYHLNLLSGNGIWSCLFFHLGRFPGLGVVGNKFGTKHVLMCLHSATACTECPRASSPGSSSEKWTPQKWVSSWRIPCTPCASQATVLFDSAHLSPCSLHLVPFSVSYFFWLFCSAITVFPWHSEATA